MRCLKPRSVGFAADGKTIAWSQKSISKEFSTFQLPCGKCLECRLEYGRQWAVRCVHEAETHEHNCFITLTYSDKNLKSDRLQKRDIDLFIKKLRDSIFQKTVEKHGKNWSKMTNQEKKQFRIDHQEELKKSQISIFGVGEYGDKKKDLIGIFVFLTGNRQILSIFAQTRITIKSIHLKFSKIFGTSTTLTKNPTKLDKLHSTLRATVLGMQLKNLSTGKTPIMTSIPSLSNQQEMQLGNLTLNAIMATSLTMEFLS